MKYILLFGIGLLFSCGSGSNADHSVDVSIDTWILDNQELKSALSDYIRALDEESTHEKSFIRMRYRAINDSTCLYHLSEGFHIAAFAFSDAPPTLFQVEKKLGIAPQDTGKLKHGDMGRIARAFARKMGLDNHQWIACTHKDTGKPHIHLIANRIGVDGKVFDTTFMSNRSVRIAEEISREMGLTIANDVRKQKEYQKVYTSDIRQQSKIVVDEQRHY